MIVEVVPYRAEWPEAFAQEKEAILSLGLSTLVRVHHIGSTAVEGLSAKPIIDLMLEVQAVSELDLHDPAFKSLGYEVMGEFGIQGRRYFRKGGEMRTHHVHAFEVGSPHVARHLAFRDYLRNHPAVREEYGELKLMLAQRHAQDIEDYFDGKDGFVKKHEALALAWAERKTLG